MFDELGEGVCKVSLGTIKAPTINPTKMHKTIPSANSLEFIPRLRKFSDIYDSLLKKTTLLTLEFKYASEPIIKGHDEANYRTQDSTLAISKGFQSYYFGSNIIPHSRCKSWPRRLILAVNGVVTVYETELEEFRFAFRKE